MHIHPLDSYRPGESLIHRLDPRVKLALAGLFILTAALTPDRRWAAFGLLEALVLLATLASRVGMGLVQRRSAVALPFALAALTVAFSTPGRVVWAVSLLGGLWVVTDAGLLRFLSIVARSYLSVQAAVLLAATTPFPDLLWGMRALRVPQTLVTITGFLYRYLFVLADEARRMVQAREARSTAPDGGGGGSVIWRAQVTGAMVGSLFLRSYERSERIYAAMLARGYDGTTRTLSPPSLCPADLIVGLLVGLALVGVLVVGGLG